MGSNRGVAGRYQSGTMGEIQVFEAVRQTPSGAVHRVDRDGYLAWLPLSADRQTGEVLRHLVSLGPVDPSLRPGHRAILWPADILVDGDGRVAGCLLPDHATLPGLAEKLSAWKAATRPDGADDGALARLTVAANIAWTVAALHRRRITLGRIDPETVAVGPTMLTMLTRFDLARGPDEAPGGLRRDRRDLGRLIDAILDGVDGVAQAQDFLNREHPPAPADLHNALAGDIAALRWRGGADPLIADLYDLERAMLRGDAAAAVFIWQSAPGLAGLDVAAQFIMPIRRWARQLNGHPGLKTRPSRDPDRDQRARGPVGPMLAGPAPIRYRKIGDGAGAEGSIVIAYSIRPSRLDASILSVMVEIGDIDPPPALAVINRATGLPLPHGAPRRAGGILRLDITRPLGPIVIAVDVTGEDRAHYSIVHPPLTERMIGRPVETALAKQKLRRKVVAPGFRRP